MPDDKLTHVDLFSGIPSEDSLLRQDGRDSKQSPSVKSNRSVRKFSRQGSGLLPTPGTPRPHDNEKTAGAYYPSQNQKDLTFAIHSLSPTSETSTAPDSEEQLYLLGDFPANLSVAPGSERARRTTATSGRKCLGLYRRQGPLGRLVRTLLESSTWNSNKCVLTWKAKVMKSSRLLFQLAPSTPHTAGTGFGLLPTAKSQNSTGASEHGQGGKDLQTTITLLPTPMGISDSPAAHNKTNGEYQLKINKLLRDGKSLGLKLQPAFVEWMMGFPDGWTDLKHSAMPSSRKSYSRSSRQSRR